MVMVKMADLFFHFASAKAAAGAVLAASATTTVDAGGTVPMSTLQIGPVSNTAWLLQECHLQCLHTWEPCPSHRLQYNGFQRDVLVGRLNG